MCVIFTFTPALRDDALSAARTARRSNADGASLLLMSKGKIVLSVSGTWDTAVLAIARSIPADRYDRAFLHLRLSTAGAVTTANCHGWGDRATGQVHVQHNGWIVDSGDTAVDSQAILQWVEIGGTVEALHRLKDESFANVFLIDEGIGVYYVHRSLTGSLYTDGEGNYGTVPFGPVSRPVPQFSQFEYDMISGDRTWENYFEPAGPSLLERAMKTDSRQWLPGHIDYIGAKFLDADHTADRWQDDDDAPLWRALPKTGG